MCFCFVGEGAFIDLEKNFRKQLDNLDPNALEVIFIFISNIKEFHLNYYALNYGDYRSTFFQHFIYRKATIQH